jgi:carboxynorspermidine decarboxylase
VKFVHDVELPTPCTVVDLGLLRKNLAVLDRVQQESGAKILLALKGFAMWSVFPTLREVLNGVTASSVHEARLGAEEFRRQVHAYAPAYSRADVEAIAPICDHLVFNSTSQWNAHAALARSINPRCSLGVRINPEHSEVKTPLYDPCAPRSRLGVTRAQFDANPPQGLDGLHFHTLCELGADALERTVAAVEKSFGAELRTVKWLNLGGGHHITRPGYDVDALIQVVRGLKTRYDVEVFLEPGEAIALHTGFLVTSVLDMVDNGGPIAILDTSATAHMPDVLEMPYRPQIVGAGEPGEKPHTVRLGGLTCLAGDVIGDYSFDAPLRVGDRLVFTDMAHYTMVKNTTFNGVQLPAIATFDPSTGRTQVVRRFGYEDYKSRLS